MFTITGSGSLYKNGTVQQTVERVLPVAGRLPMTGY
ncbi:VWA domain-containing protein [Bacillus sonorensis]|nr:VWA domain-containing protein [Bacillus sonorensis]